MLLTPLLTPEMTQLTLPEERELITDLATAVEIPRISGMPAYRPELPQHNNHHVYEEVMPEGLRLVGRDGENNTSRNRLIVAAGTVVHDMWSHLPLDRAEGFRTKEERTAALAAPILLRFFDKTDTEEIQGTVLVTAPKSVCKTPNERKVRRADISNVGSKTRLPFLATTARLFHEEVMLSLEADKELPLWKPFLDKQHEALDDLLTQDLSLSTERVRRGIGPFNRLARNNNRLLATKRAVRNPNVFINHYGPRMRQLIPAFDEIAVYMRREATSSQDR